MNTKDTKLNEKEQNIEDKIIDALLNSDTHRTKKIHIDRLGIDITVHGLTQPELYAAREQSKFNDKIDDGMFNVAIINIATSFPNWSDSRLTEKYGGDSFSVIKKVFLAGEMEKLCGEILNLSGFGQTIDEIKNS